MCAILCHSASSIMMSHSVILNAIRCHSEYTLCHSERSEESPQSRPATTRTLYAVILNTRSVILNGVKNLEVSVAVDGSTSLEILRYTQDDIEPTMARRCFALLSMT